MGLGNGAGRRSVDEPPVDEQAELAIVGDAELARAHRSAHPRLEDHALVARYVFFVYSASLRWWIASPKPDPRTGIADLRRLLRLLVAGLR